jgi:hypothetical protein
MAGNTLSVTSSLQCPHGGSVQIISANVRVKVDSACAALATDQFVVSGCPFQIPIGTGTKPSPCVTVKWLVTDLRVKVNSTPTLSRSSVGICQSAEQIPQGPVSIVNTQVKAQTQ